MTAHTKGPWEFLGDPEDDECRVRQTESVRHGRGFCSEITICENIRSEANAKLIAAAPDLLEACEAHIAALRSQIRDGKYRPEYAEAIYQAQNKMEAAIAKAKGE